MTEKQLEILKAHIREVLSRNLDQRLTIELANGVYGTIEGKINELHDASNAKRG